MDQKNIALELLVRSGNPKGVELFAESEVFDGTKRIEKVAEAGVYSAIRHMLEEAEGGIDSEKICSIMAKKSLTIE